MDNIKTGWKTTEFWVALGTAIIGVLFAFGFFTMEQSTVLIAAMTQISGVIVMVIASFGYSVSRGLTKKKQ